MVILEMAYLVRQEKLIYVIPKEVFSNLYLVKYILEIINKIREMVKEKKSTLTMTSMRVIGKMIRNMEMGDLNQELKVGNMWVSGRTTFDMGRVNLQASKQRSGTRVSGLKTKSMVLVKSPIKMDKLLRADGKTMLLSIKKQLMIHKAIGLKES